MMQNYYRKHFVNRAVMCVWLLAFFVSGCAGMAINEKTKTLDLTKESIVLMTVKTANNYKPIYQPNVQFIRIFTAGNKDKKDLHLFRATKPYNKVAQQFNEYLISINLPAGNYELKEITGQGTDGFFNGNFVIPLYINFELKPNKLVYLGHIEATNRKRAYDYELRAGSMIPLLDQAVTGFSGGTFDVNIYDNFDRDLAVFKKEYPVIGEYNDEKMILTPRKKALEETE